MQTNLLFQDKKLEQKFLDTKIFYPHPTEI